MILETIRTNEYTGFLKKTAMEIQQAVVHHKLS